MRRVKEHVHYFCDDTLFGHIDGHGITTAVLDTGDRKSTRLNSSHQR